MKVRPPVRPEFTSLRAHRAERRRIRRDLRSRDGYRRDRAAVDQHLWAYKDAQLREESGAAEAAWLAFRQVVAASGGRFDWYASADFVRLAAGFDDVDRAARELGEWRRHVDTGVYGTDNQQRTSARTFIWACVLVLKREASIGHRQEPVIEELMREVGAGMEGELESRYREDLWRVGELRAWVRVGRSSERLAAALRLPETTGRRPLPAAGPPDGPVDTVHRQWRRRVTGAGSVADRARLAAAWVVWAVGTREPGLAAEAYQEVLLLVPLVVAERPAGGDREQVLAAVQEHTEEAGYWLARTGKYREAVVVLETGRAVGISLDNPAYVDTGGDGPARVPTYADLLAGTGDGPLVYLAAATAGGYALVVAAQHDPQLVELPPLDRARVRALLDRLLPGATAASAPVTRSALRRPAAPAGERDAVVGARRPGDLLAEGLASLWDEGLRPLAFAAGGPVVTFLPVGLLSLLPLHAAGAPGDPSDRRVDWRHLGTFTAVRYAPNTRTLVRCRETARDLAAGPRSLLAVAVPVGYGVGAHGFLRFVAREAAEVARRWGAPVSTLHGATWEEFRAVGDRYTVWHLACHGSAQPWAIQDSRLYFADRSVTLRELREALPAGRRRLAVLSACESNLTDAHLPNEVVGLPSALLQAGFAGVVASSWKVDDLATAYLMTAFYQQWCQEGQEPVVALNLAQRWLRTATRSDLVAMLPGVEPGGGDGDLPYRHPRYWAAFAYTGV